MKTGTIVLTPFPFTDLTTVKSRPVVIISPVSTANPDVIVAFITSVLPKTLSTSDYVLETTHPDFKLSGLKKSSVFKMDKIATLDKSIFLGKIGEVSQAVFGDLQTKLKIALDLI